MKKIMVFGALLCLIASAADAGMIDLTTAGSSGSFLAGTDLFEQIDPSSTGTGVIDSFVRIQTNENIVQGFNTDGTRQFDEKGGNFTHSLTLTSIPIVEINGIDYRQFLLDINQEGGDPLISLNEIQIFIGTTGSPTVADPMNPGDPISLSGSTLIYDMDATEDNTIELNYNLNTGSGSGDMFAYIADSLFNSSLGTFVTLYSKFGSPNNNNDGFEEWAVLLPTGTPDPNPPVPEPASIVLFGLGAALLATRRRKSDNAA